MKLIVTKTMLLCGLFVFSFCLWGQIPLSIEDDVDPPEPFNLLMPFDGSSHFIPSPTESIIFSWEDVLGLGDEWETPNNISGDFSRIFGERLLFIEEDDDSLNLLPDKYYSVLISIDPELTLGFPLPWEQPGFVADGVVLGLLQYVLELLFEEPLEEVTLFWTIGATNEGGTTWANDTFSLSYEIMNAPPSSDFDLLHPVHGSTVEIKGDVATGMPLSEDITFEWQPSTDPDGDDLFYWWVASNVYPIPSLFDLIDDDVDTLFFRYNNFKPIYKKSSAISLMKGAQEENDTLVIILPSGDFTFLRNFLDEDLDDFFDDEDPDLDPEEIEFLLGMLMLMLQGGEDAWLKLPSELFYLMMLEEFESDEITMYWTAVTTDGFSFLHWTPSNDTSAVTMELTFVSDVKQISNVPTEYYLRQNYPNPFNPVTNIEYGIKSDAQVELRIYNMLGQEVMEVVNEYQQAGNYRVSIDGSRLSSGVYFYKLRAGADLVGRNRMILVK